MTRWKQRSYRRPKSGSILALGVGVLISRMIEEMHGLFFRCLCGCNELTIEKFPRFFSPSLSVVVPYFSDFLFALLTLRIYSRDSCRVLILIF